MLDFDPTQTRLFFFVSAFILFAGLEALFPRKQRVQSWWQRWLTNFGMVFINSIALRLLGALTAISVAAFAADRDWGLFNIIELPVILSISLAVILLDMAIYWQHVASHHWRWLWRFHRVHHADRDIDASTGIRFHPIEVILSMLFKCVVVFILGAPVLAVLMFEIILNASAMFNHANMRLPLWLDKWLRFIVVTPDMHRVHHSIITRETNSNYGFFLSIWDRLFGSYIDQPELGHDNMTIGLPTYQSQQPAKLLWCLLSPFKSKNT